MRLIDADNLEFCGICVFDHDGEPMMRMEDVRESVDNAPTIDAVPDPNYRVPSTDEWMERYCTKKQLAGYEKRKEGDDNA